MQKGLLGDFVAVVIVAQDSIDRSANLTAISDVKRCERRGVTGSRGVRERGGPIPRRVRLGAALDSGGPWSFVAATCQVLVRIASPGVKCFGAKSPEWVRLGMQ